MRNDSSQAGALRSYLVRYCLDLTSSQCDYIPIGVIAAFRVGPRFALGLRVRSQLPAQDLQKIAKLAQPLFSRPFATLKIEFEKVWEAPKPDMAFSELSRVGSSLQFDSLQSSEIRPPSSVREFGHDSNQLKGWMREEVQSCLQERFDSFCSNIGDDASEDFARLAA
ncbi:MAG: hypothetical protein INF34_00190 [Roseomonas sp.]|nr:hypothetical protein [Roseomonas sp.]